MPGLFDMVKQGALGLFGGDVGGGRALQTAGAAAILADTQDPLEAIAAASMAGQNAGQMIQEKAIKDANRAQLAALIQDVGMDPGGLQKVFLEALGNGQIDEAKAIAEILKTMGPRAQPNLSFSTHDRYNPETGQMDIVRIGQDPTNGSVVSQTIVGSKPMTEKNDLITRTIDADTARLSGFDRGGTFLGYDDPRTGRFTPTQRLQADEAGIMDVAADRMAEMKDSDWLAVGSLPATLERMRGDGLFARGARIVGGLLTGAEAEAANSAAGLALMAMQQDLSGKQMTEAERTFMDGFMMPRVLDEDSEKIRKGHFIQTYIRARSSGLSISESIRTVRTVHEDELPLGGGAEPPEVDFDEWQARNRSPGS